MGERIDWAALSDKDFVERAETQIWLSAFASNNPRAPAHTEVDATYDEAQRREKPWLYQRAYNSAYRSCGFTPSRDEVEKAKEPSDRNPAYDGPMGIFEGYGDEDSAESPHV